jgi:cell division ATPase FtsA
MTHSGDLAKEILGLPVQIGFPLGLGGMLDKVDDPAFATVAGLVLWSGQQGAVSSEEGFLKSKAIGILKQGTGDGVEKAREWFKKFLP